MEKSLNLKYCISNPSWNNWGSNVPMICIIKISRIPCLIKFFFPHTKDYIICLLSLFLTSTNIVFDLNFHFVLMFFLKAWIFWSMCLLSPIFLLLPLLVVKFILVSFIFFLAQLMAVVLMKEVWLVVALNDLFNWSKITWHI